LLREIRQEKERNKLKLIAWMQDFQSNKNKTKQKHFQQKFH
jgi:hypothetical protein